ncbi:hypothetical protein DFP72DRAFT_1076122 [Ephemerocybe angulata]|uniref:Uncharacterized protein n=1 Tax=Ephemerocybe angulata TaxID=980116 RepID=A0A8H6LZI3_9AGAR|nr:hypothetical protein DFP72DRAFT_1076122 [Tulosesus angulatus]
MRTTLTSLAPELIEEICAKVQESYSSTLAEIKRDLRNLRLVCQQTRTPPEHYLFRDITLDAQAIAKDTTIFRNARVLRLQFGSAESTKGWNQIKMDGMSDAFVVPILSAFRSVKSVEWRVESADPCPQILDALSTLPEMTTLILHFNRVPFHDFTLLKLPRLKRLAILNTLEQNFTKTLLQEITELLETYTTLTHVAIDTKFPFSPDGPRFRFPKPPSAPASVPTEGDALEATTGDEPGPLQGPALQSLRLHGCGFVFKARPYLSTLTTLEVQNEDYPSNRTIWASLYHVENVKLKSIVVDSLHPFLIQYLQSYSGLEKLIFTEPKDRAEFIGPIPPQHQAELGSMDADFYTKIVPLHQDSLQSLSLYHLSPSDWRPSDSKTAALLRCSKLSTLSIDFSCNNLSTLPVRLKRVLSTLLKFEALRFLAINLVTSGGDTSLGRWGVEGGIMDYPVPREGAFKISTGTCFFVPTLDGDRRRWRKVPFKAAPDMAIQLGWVL